MLWHAVAMMPGIPWLTVQNKPSFFMKEQLDPLSEADAPVVAAHYTGLVEKYRSIRRGSRHSSLSRCKRRKRRRAGWSARGR